MPERVSFVIRKSIMAGLCIGIGSTIFLLSESRILGTFLFTIGLFLICTYGFSLFTGKVGYSIKKRKETSPLYYLLVWLGNLIGCFMIALPVRLTNLSIHEKAVAVVNNKLSLSVPQTVVFSIFCGVLVFFAVDIYKKNISSVERILGLVACVSVFIFSGFEHSIADMCYMIYGITTDFESILKAVIFVLIVSVSNALGSILICTLSGDEKK